MCMAVSSGKSTKSGRGVYAGVDHSGFDQVIYLRDDGTYTEELGTEAYVNVKVSADKGDVTVVNLPVIAALSLRH